MRFEERRIMKDILNVEIKAKLINASFVREKLKGFNASFKGVDKQVDTYFNCEDGRLKLREGNIENSLIFYKRSDKNEARESEIKLFRLKPDPNLKEVLTASNGIKVVVSKEREIYFIDNVKFHIDKLDNLGEFVEIEAIDELGNIGKDKLKEQCDFYIKELGLLKENFLSKSYSDMILEKA